MIKLLIYDLDGTLIDSKRDIANAVNWTLKELGLKTLSVNQISSFVGNGVLHLMQSVLGEASGGTKRSDFDLVLKRSVQLYRTRYANHLVDETTLYPSVQEVLEHFKNFRQAVITNKPEEFSREILKRLGISAYFFRILGGDQGWAKKPAPEPVLDVVRSAGALPRETVLIGDSLIDIQTGKNARIKTVAVTYGFGSLKEIKEGQPDWILGHLSELIRCPLLAQSS